MGAIGLRFTRFRVLQAIQIKIIADRQPNFSILGRRPLKQLPYPIITTWKNSYQVILCHVYIMRFNLICLWKFSITYIFIFQGKCYSRHFMHTQLFTHNRFKESRFNKNTEDLFGMLVFPNTQFFFETVCINLCLVVHFQ